MAKQTLVQAVAAINNTPSSVVARQCQFGSIPFGDPQIGQAKRNLCDALPARGQRSYTVDHLVEALYSDTGDRPVRRSPNEALMVAARIKASLDQSRTDLRTISDIID